MESVAGSSRGPRAWEVATGGCPWASSGGLSVVNQWGSVRKDHVATWRFLRVSDMEYLNVSHC